MEKTRGGGEKTRGGTDSVKIPFALFVETGDIDGPRGGGENTLGTGDRALEAGDIGRSIMWFWPVGRCELLIDSFDDPAPIGRRTRLELEFVPENGMDSRLLDVPATRPAKGQASTFR